MAKSWQDKLRDIVRAYPVASKSDPATLPIGAVYLTTTDQNPTDELGYGAWEAMPEFGVAAVTAWKRTA